MLPSPKEMIRHARQIATSLSSGKSGGHPVDYYGIFHIDGPEKCQYVCRICKPGLDVKLNGVNALEKHLESEEHNNNIKFHLPENNKLVQEAMLNESTSFGTTTRQIIENVKDLDLAQYTPRDLILAAWKIKENLKLDFKGGHRVDYYGIVSVPSSPDGKFRYKCIVCNVPLTRDHDVEKHLKGENEHMKAIISHHPDNNRQVQSALRQLEEERGGVITYVPPNILVAGLPQRNSQQQLAQPGTPQIGVPISNPHQHRQLPKQVPVSGSGCNSPLNYQNILSDGASDWCLQPPQHWGYAPACYPFTIQQQQQQVLLGSRSMTHEITEFLGELAINPYSTAGRGHGRGMPSMLGNVPNLL